MNNEVEKDEKYSKLMIIKLSNILKMLIFLTITQNLIIAEINPKSEFNPKSTVVNEARHESSIDTKILVHYMPWYQSPSISGYWAFESLPLRNIIRWLRFPDAPAMPQNS